MAVNLDLQGRFLYYLAFVYIIEVIVRLFDASQVFADTRSVIQILIPISTLFFGLLISYFVISIL